MASKESTITFANRADVHHFAPGDLLTGRLRVMRLDFERSALIVRRDSRWLRCRFWLRGVWRDTWWSLRCRWADWRERLTRWRGGDEA